MIWDWSRPAKAGLLTASAVPAITSALRMFIAYLYVLLLHRKFKPAARRGGLAARAGLQAMSGSCKKECATADCGEHPRPSLQVRRRKPRVTGNGSRRWNGKAQRRRGAGRA